MELVEKIENYLLESTFNVTLNWYGELHNFTMIQASNEKQASMKCMYGLAKKLGKDVGPVRRYFSSGDRIKVEKV